ncbi:tetratricopeptide repeat protein [Streptomyces sp. NBC_01497]|uniref:tetratricopeptide repeat protein n=1 Tax=Streptomyces sp. NBC_01497 TaxID=2903885 RepID=UPI002E364894|nr:tetratricopeptide repeat protein [Streptomyces sp. NBC_01497]
MPLPDPDDPATVVLTQQATQSPDRIAAEARDNPSLGTAEAAFWLCRAYLETGDAVRASHWLDRARERLESGGGTSRSAEHEWRLPWHSGVLYLARGEVGAAADEFAATYALLPGEWAPKPALGFCSEHSGVTGSLTRDYYEAVWRRSKSQGSAALGLARVHLRAGDRVRALAVLDSATSRHYDVARVAAVRVLAGRIGDVPATAGQPAEAAQRFGRLGLEQQAAARLAAEILPGLRLRPRPLARHGERAGDLDGR